MAMVTEADISEEEDVDVDELLGAARGDDLHSGPPPPRNESGKTKDKAKNKAKDKAKDKDKDKDRKERKVNKADDGAGEDQKRIKKAAVAKIAALDDDDDQDGGFAPRRLQASKRKDKGKDKAGLGSGLG